MAGFFENDAIPHDDKKGSGFFENDAIPAQEPEAPPLEEMGSYALDQVIDPIKEALTTLSAPFAELDKLTGAPPRAAVGALQEGKGFPGAAQAFVDQIKAGAPSIEGGMVQPGKILPGTPTGTDIAKKGMTSAGIAGPFADKMAPAAGIAADVTLDLTNLIPGEAATGALKLGRKGIIKGAEVAENVAAKGLMGTGRLLTGGALNYDKAIQAAKTLRSYELMMPGSPELGFMSSAMKDVGEARKALQAQKITVPGSHEVALQVADMIGQARNRALSAPNADLLIQRIQDQAFEAVPRMTEVPIPPAEVQPVIDQAKAELHDILAQGDEIQRQTGQNIFAMHPELNAAYQAKVDQIRRIEEMAAAGKLTRQQVIMELQRRELSLDELDDLTGMLDEAGYTPTGNPKMMRRVWGPTIKKARASIDQVMQTVPEGAAFKTLKTRQEALMTAAKGRSKLITYGIMTNAPVAALTLHPAAILATAMLPQTYFKMMGTLKLPTEFVQGLTAAKETGKLAAVRDFLASMSEKFPVATERFIRATALVSGKPEGQQFLTDEEANTLGKVRIFDVEQIAAEKQRLQNDKNMSSVEKARRLSDINRNGYVTMDAPNSIPETQSVTTEVFGGQSGLESLIQSLQNYGG